MPRNLCQGDRHEEKAIIASRKNRYESTSANNLTCAKCWVSILVQESCETTSIRENESSCSQCNTVVQVLTGRCEARTGVNPNRSVNAKATVGLHRTAIESGGCREACSERIGHGCRICIANAEALLAPLVDYRGVLSTQFFALPESGQTTRRGPTPYMFAHPLLIRGFTAQ